MGEGDTLSFSQNIPYTEIIAKWQFLIKNTSTHCCARQLQSIGPHVRHHANTILQHVYVEKEVNRSSKDNEFWENNHW